MTRIDLTKGQCTALAAYLRGKVTSHACATYDDVELWVLAVRAEVLRTYLDESAACIPPKVYRAISSAVVLMGAFGEALDVAVNAMVSARASAIAEVSAHVEKRDER